MTLAHLHNLIRLAAGFEVSVTTVWPYLRRTTPVSTSATANVQVLADAAGRLVWASAALPGLVHDLTAARTHGMIDALTSANVLTFADKGYRAPAAPSGPRSTAAAPARPADDRSASTGITSNRITVATRLRLCLE